jgi:hypothetical protein
MATALSSLRARLQIKLRESDARKNAVNLIELDQALIDHYFLLAARLPGSRIYEASSFTISAGGDTFALPTTSSRQYGGDVRVRLRSNGQFLDKLTVEELDAFRNGDDTPVPSIPRYFCLWEESDQEVQGRVYPGAEAAEVCDLFAELLPADPRAAANLEAVSLELSRFGETALLFATAADLVAAMSPEDLAERRLSKDVVPSWTRTSEVALYQEAARHHALADVGRTQRWVS